MLSASDPTLPAGEPPRPVCQRCGRSVDKDAIGTQVGLCHCMICEVYACRRCWADADGTCPSCGVRYAPAALLAVGAAADAGVATAADAGVATTVGPAGDAGVATAVVTGAVVAGAGGSSAPGRRPDIRAPLAIGTLVVALALLGLAFGGPLGSTAGSLEATPTPALGVVASAASDATGSPSVAPSGDAIATRKPSSVPTSTDRATPDGTATTDDASREPPRATATATPAGRSGPTPPPAATPTPTPVPTPTPTPTATPRPTPTPSPTPSCKLVPNLVGSTVTAARAAWTVAGFTGALQQVRGPNSWYVKSQDPLAGACVAVSSSMSVTTAKTP